jgi:outer membrane protein OmpA-like peptidoglycan-associated protein
MKTLLTSLLAAGVLLAASGAPASEADAGFLGEINLTTGLAPDVELLRPVFRGERFEFIPIQPVHFAHDEDELDEHARWILDDAAVLIRHLQGVTRVIVKGFTDVVASEHYNDALSDRRAVAVRDYLIERGIAPRMLHTTGYGKSVPVDEEWTREGRARNRRVEITLVRRHY